MYILNPNTQSCALNTTALTITCLDGQRVDAVNNKCVSCPQGCTKCVTSSSKRGFICTVCDSASNFVFRDDYCFLSCDAGSMPAFQADGSQACKACTAPCTNCKMNYLSSPPSEVCFSCELGFFV